MTACPPDAHVLYLSPAAQLGGAELSLLDLMNGVRQAWPACRQTVLVAADGPLTERLRSLGFDVLELPFPAPLAALNEFDAGAQRSTLKRLLQRLSAVAALINYVRSLRRQIRVLAPGLLHSNGLKMHVLGALACPAKTPLIWHVRDYLSHRRLSSTLLRLLKTRCSAVIAISQSVAADCRQIFSASPCIHTLRDGIDLDQFAPQGPVANLDELSALPSPEAGTVRIGLPATFAHWKGHDVFLKAIAQLPQELAWRAYIIGAPLYQTASRQFSVAELKTLAAKLGIPLDRLGCTGFVDQPECALRALDIVVHASTSPEPLGRIAMEAQACGKVLVFSGAGGVMELAIDGDTAVSHRTSDADDLACKLLELLNAPERRDQIQSAAIKHARVFSKYDYGVAIANLFKSMLSLKPTKVDFLVPSTLPKL